jgi:uncharacterized protein (TIGR03435 family)
MATRGPADRFARNSARCRFTGWRWRRAEFGTDETGPGGAYDLELKYSLEMAAPDAGAAAKDPSMAFPSLFTALKEQSGLRLTGKKGTALVWVVVRAEKPGEN